MEAELQKQLKLFCNRKFVSGMVHNNLIRKIVKRRHVFKLRGIQKRNYGLKMSERLFELMRTIRTFELCAKSGEKSQQRNSACL